MWSGGPASDLADANRGMHLLDAKSVRRGQQKSGTCGILRQRKAATFVQADSYTFSRRLRGWRAVACSSLC